VHVDERETRAARRDEDKRVSLQADLAAIKHRYDDRRQGAILETATRVVTLKLGPEALLELRHGRVTDARVEPRVLWQREGQLLRVGKRVHKGGGVGIRQRHVAEAGQQLDVGARPLHGCTQGDS
jgi:hypothetical protein